jgi:hypothetical protein
MCNSRTPPKAATLKVLLLPPPSALHQSELTSSHEDEDEKGESSLPTEELPSGIGSNENHATFAVHDESLMKHRRRAAAFLRSVKQKLMVRSKSENSVLDDSHARKIGFVEGLSFDDDEPTDETSPDDDSLTQEDTNDVIDSQKDPFHSTVEVQENASKGIFPISSQHKCPSYRQEPSRHLHQLSTLELEQFGHYRSP